MGRIIHLNVTAWFAVILQVQSEHIKQGGRQQSGEYSQETLHRTENNLLRECTSRDSILLDTRDHSSPYPSNAHALRYDTTRQDHTLSHRVYSQSGSALRAELAVENEHSLGSWIPTLARNWFVCAEKVAFDGICRV